MSEYVQAILIAPRTHYTCSLPLKVRRKYIYSYEDRLIQLYELKSFFEIYDFAGKASGDYECFFVANFWNPELPCLKIKSIIE